MDIVLDTCPAPECNLTPRDVSGLLDQLAAYHAHFVSAFARSEQSYWAETYLQGLLSTCERKSIEPMALHLGVPIRPLQHFIGQSTWSIEPTHAQHQLLVGSTLADEDGVFLVDECGVLKQGHDSVGVAPQYCGSVGKVANSQGCQTKTSQSEQVKSPWDTWQVAGPKLGIMQVAEEALSHGSAFLSWWCKSDVWYSICVIPSFQHASL